MTLLNQLYLSVHTVVVGLPCEDPAGGGRIFFAPYMLPLIFSLCFKMDLSMKRFKFQERDLHFTILLLEPL